MEMPLATKSSTDFASIETLKSRGDRGEEACVPAG